MKIAAQTDRGKRREHNEDCYYIDQKYNLFVIADGMGGHSAGGIASQMVVAVFQNWVEGLNGGPTSSLNASPSEKKEVLSQLTMEANRRVYTYSRQHSFHEGMGTTLTTGFLQFPHLVYVHVGDSRLYILRDGTLTQITKDHSLVQEMVDAGKMSPERARVHPQRNIIRKAVGLESTVSIDSGCYPIQQGDIVLVCTDGLHDMIVDDTEIASLITSAPNLGAACHHLVNASLDYGGVDNVTLILATPD
jgi:serine/threonine protein phosphatase PrpC